MRDRITRELITKKGFRFVAIEGDWPDAARVDHYVRHLEYPPSEWTAFARFPTWMWRNNEVRAFVDWLRAHNAPLKIRVPRVAFHGLDLYSLYNSIRAVLRYLDRVDPATAQRRARALRLPDALAVRSRHLWPCRSDRRLSDLRVGSRRRADRSAAQAPRIRRTRRRALHGCGAKRPARSPMPSAITASCITARAHPGICATATCSKRLKTLLAFYGPSSKAIVWAHNSHIGDAAATEMFSRGEYNLGHLCRKEFGTLAYTIGFGTNAARSRRHRIGTARWRSRQSCPRSPRAMSRSAMRPACRPFCLDLRQALEWFGRPAQATSGARDRRDLSAGNGARQPLLSGRAAGAVR